MQGRNDQSANRPPLDFWFDADPDQVRARLAEPDLDLDEAAIGALRDRAAGQLLADPSFAYSLSSLLIRRIRSKSHDPGGGGIAMAWRCRAEACLFTGRLRMAKEAYERASESARSADQNALLGQILVGRVHLLSLLGESAQSDGLALEAERLLTKAGDSLYLGKLHMNRGNALYQQERHERALEAYRKAGEIFAAADQRDATWVGLLMNQAIACTNLSRVDEARRLFDETERHSQRLELDSLLAHARFNRAWLESLAGDYRSALALLEDTAEAFAEQGQRDMVAATQRSRAEIYLKLGLTREAEELALASAESFDSEGMELDAALSRLDAARAQFEGDAVARGLDLLGEVHEFFKKRRIRPRTIQIRLMQAQAQLRAGEPTKSATLARRALRGFDSLGMVRGSVSARRALAEAQLALDKAKEAEATLAPAILLARDLATDDRILLWELAGKVARALGKRGEARSYLSKAAAQFESLRRLIPGVELRARAARLHSGIFDELIELTLDSPRPTFASLYPLVEAARARGFRERISLKDEPSAESESRVVDEERAELGLLTRKLEEAEFAGLGISDPDAMKRLRKQALAMEKRLITRRRREQTKEMGAAQSLGELPKPDRVARALAKDEILLQYFVAGDRILCLALGEKTQVMKELAAHPDDVRAALQLIRFQFDAVALAAGAPARLEFLRPGAEQILAKLHALLVAPLADVIQPGGRLTVIPHGFLHAVPFECLHDGDSYLIDEHIIQRAPTVGFLLRREAKTGGRKRNVIICGNPSSGLAHVEAEVKAVARHLMAGGRRVRVLEDPSSGEILAALPTSRLLHMSTHGLFRGDNPLFSRLSTRDGAVFLADIVALKLGADLIVLSACESGQVMADSGDELDGVAHGFLAAGARNLVASRWQVHDEATVALMDSFYGQLAGQRRWDPALALAGASREIREAWPHPFFWGAFSVFGA